jgi:hypothetical protein
MATRGKSARNAGNQYEREVAQEFRDLGFDECVTSRSESKRTDDKGIDLCFTNPFNIQCKRWKSAPAYQDTLKSMPDDCNYNILMHKKPHKGEVVVMEKETFYELIRMLKSENII